MSRPAPSVLVLLLLPACAAEVPEPAGPERMAVAEGFSTPESVAWDAEQGVWFVTNINGGPSDKDNNGFISRLTVDGAIEVLEWVAGGRDGVTLHAPKGTAIQGDTLWVADIDALRGFDRRTGAPVATVEFGRRARFLNGLAMGPDNALYLTDTGIRIGPEGMEHPGPDRIFRVAGRDITVLAEGEYLEAPNGIAWDPGNGRFIMVPFGGTTIFEVTPGGTVSPIGEGPGQHDGVLVLADGRILVSSWADSTLFLFGPEGNTPVVSGIEAPADLGIDRARGIVAIPLFMQNRVEFWRVP